MNQFDIAGFALYLSARVFMPFLIARPDMTILTGLYFPDAVVSHQEHYTALDVIIVTRRICLFQLPERCESKKEHTRV